MCRGLGWLEPRDFEPKVSQGGLALTKELMIRGRDLGKHLAGNRESFSVD